MALNLQATGMEFASELVVKAALYGQQVTEVPTTLAKDGRSRPPHLHTWRDGWRHLRFLLLFSPRWLFFLPGLALLIAGLIIGALVAPHPFSIGSVTFDVDTLVAASAMVVIGFQSVLFWLFTQVYAGSEGFLPEEPKVQRVLEKLSLERGLMLGGLIGLAGLAGLIFSLLYWNGQKFSHLNYEHSLRLMIPSVTALIVSWQVILGTFFLSILGIKHTRHPVAATSAPASAPSADEPVNHREQSAAANRLLGMRTILSAPAWPYANGPRHIGHVSGFALPCDMFSRYQRMAGNRVLMVSGTDEHGTPIQVQADAEGVSARELADRYNRVIVNDLTSLGMTYDLFTRTTTLNHYAVTQEIFIRLLENGYIFSKTTLGAISPSTGRTLPDRYIEGTCPICGNPLDPADLINPRSKINGETPIFRETEHYFLDLPAFAEVLGTWLQAKAGHWRPNVLKFSLNLLDDLQPRAITRDLDWGVPVPLDGWRDRPDKRIYVWFDAVIGYLSASIEWARRSGDPDAWRAWWNEPDAEAYYFMGKDNIVFHSEIWPAMLLGYSGLGARGGQPGPLGKLNLPTEVVSSEYLTMEGRKFSSSRAVVIYVRDFLDR